MHFLTEHPGLWFVAATLLPLVSVVILLLAGFFRNALRRTKNTEGLGKTLFYLLGGEVTGRVPAYVATAAIGLAFVCSTIGFVIFLADGHGHHAGGHDHAKKHDEAKEKDAKDDHEPGHGSRWAGSMAWASVNPKANKQDPERASVLKLGYFIDSLSAIMFVMVTFVATLIHLFSIGYMADELQQTVEDHQVHTEHGHFHRRGRFGRFFLFLSLFCFSMLNLILADNLFQVFLSWELVGVCSYLLIGFYYERTSAGNAANKAFITNRVGDAGFIIGLLILWTYVGTLNFQELFQRIRAPEQQGSQIVRADKVEPVSPGEAYGAGQAASFTIKKQGEAGDFALVLPREPAGKLGVGKLKNAEGGGAKIVHVNPSGGAARAGLKPNDVIVEVGTRIKTDEDLDAALESFKGGAEVAVTVKRGKENLPLKVKLADGDKLGIELKIDAEDALIEKVASGGPAAKAGIRPGDSIVKIGTETTDAGSAEKAIKAIPLSNKLAVYVSVRHGKETRPVDVDVPAVALAPEAGRSLIAEAYPSPVGYGFMPYWMLVVAGLGIFLGCVGKSAQFPLQVWLPDAMEGPTPVSALIHAATMVAAGVYLVGRCFPLFTYEVALTIAYTGAITLFVAATIAVVMTDIKKVLAYSTVSQLGYMMLALGVGGWAAGLFHLITHAFFKALMFLASGSVIYGCHHEQEMTKMGGLFPKMKITALTMLMGVLAIAGIPLFSGWYSKDAVLASALGFSLVHQEHFLLFLLPLATAGITTFYMFRMWFMTFTGKPRDEHVHEHAKESPWPMTVPLIALAFFSVTVGWGWPVWDAEASWLEHQLHHSMPSAIKGDFGTTMHELEGKKLADSATDDLPEHLNPRQQAEDNHHLAGNVALLTVLAGLTFAFLIYYQKLMNPADAVEQFPGVYRFLQNKWYFDELYSALLVRPSLVVAGWAKWFDATVIDGILHTAAKATVLVSFVSGLGDRRIVDGLANLIASVCQGVGGWLRGAQTGYVRSYVLFLVLAALGLWILLTVMMGAPSAASVR